MINNKGERNNLFCPNGCKGFVAVKILDGTMLVCSLCGAVVGTVEGGKK